MAGIDDIPVIGGIAETAIHGAEAVGHAVEGDWDKAANSALDMAGSAAHTAFDLATDGVGGTVLDAAEGVYNAAAGGLGLPSTDEMWEGAKHGVEEAGNALGDAAYNLVHGSDDGGLAGGTGAGPADDGGLSDFSLPGGEFDDPGLGMGGTDPGLDLGGGDLGGGDLGGGDLGGGDLGGGDFGGGDLGGGDMSGGDDGGYDMSGGDMGGDGGEY
jgi:hypothetical protein